jgi:hypothetical protein
VDQNKFSQERRRAKVIPITFGKRRPAAASEPKPSSGVTISQERLKQGLELFREEMRIQKELRDFKFALEADLANGSSEEPGEYFFDRELKIVRRNAPRATAKP